MPPFDALRGPGAPAGAGDFARFSLCAESMPEEKEFFMRKAVGSGAARDSEEPSSLVFEWLLPRSRLASCLTLREAIKPRSDVQRAAILAVR